MMPGDLIREELKRRGWTQEDLARILARPLTRVSEVIHGKQAISPEIAVALAGAFGGSAEEWLRREASYRLSLTDDDGSLVRKRARLFELAPIKEMQKRGWISRTDDPLELEEALKLFFETDDLSREPEMLVAFRKSTSYAEMTPAQRAWCARARQMAKALVIPPLKRSGLRACEDGLRRLAAYPQQARKVPGIL